MTPQEAQQFRALLEARGFKQVPKDHWIYSEGPSTHFIPPKPPASAKGNTLAQKLMVELKQASRDEESLDATDVESILESEDGKSVRWVSSTWIEPELVNLFVCSAGAEPITVIATHHGDRGVLERVSGPWKSFASAKKSFGKVREGWSDMTG
jgi:hypothetical protein